MHPLQDDVTCHFVINTDTGMLDGITETGRFHLALLHLNRPQLVNYRLSQLIEARHEMLEDENRELRTILAAQQKYIDRLRHLLGENPEQGQGDEGERRGCKCKCQQPVWANPNAGTGVEFGLSPQATSELATRKLLCPIST